MSKRNLILLVIVLGILAIFAFIFFYLYQPKDKEGSSPGINFFANFLPFGKNDDTPPAKVENPVDISGYEIKPEIEKRRAKLIKVSSFPVAGFGVFMKERYKEVADPVPTTEDAINPIKIKPTPPTTEFIPTLRYANRATGNIYQTFADKIDERQFSPVFVPKVYEAYFGNKGESVIMRYLKEDNKTIETFVGSLPKELLGADGAGINEMKNSFLPENISDISISPDASKIFYMFEVSDNVMGVTLSLQTGTKIQIFDSPFTEWLSFWPNNKMVTVTTKPSSNIPGFMYAINPERKDFIKILGGINGLTTLASGDGKIVLYSDNNLSLSVFDTNSKNSELLGVKTLSEKCIWGKNSNVVYCAVPKFIEQGRYPDSWYQGEVSFSDEIWKIDVASGNTSMILDPLSLEEGESVDAIKLGLDENEDYLFFINKKDSYLWEFSLK